MFVRARSVHEALPIGLYLLDTFGERESSRYGDVLVCPMPVTTEYQQPWERCLLWPSRNANPFLHFYEGLYMLAGREKVAPLSAIVEKMQEFSDDGLTLRGAYGTRWRYAFGFDQLETIIDNLKTNPQCRRQYLTMWDPIKDLRDGEGKKDLPCNVGVAFRIVRDRLQVTVFNRSNDAIWGTYGSDAVHFSMLQEYVATRVGVQIGSYWQISNNFHAYLATLPSVAEIPRCATGPVVHPYESLPRPAPMISADPRGWDIELRHFIEVPPGKNYGLGWAQPFFRRVAIPIMDTCWLAKAKNYSAALSRARRIESADWRLEITTWIQRRISTVAKSQ